MLIAGGPLTQDRIWAVPFASFAVLLLCSQLYSLTTVLRKALSFHPYSTVSDFITRYPTLLPEYWYEDRRWRLAWFAPAESRGGVCATAVIAK